MRAHVGFISSALLMLGASAFAYPEFQAYSQKVSGRRVDCAMCHISPSGPSGTGFGQISGLGAAEKKLLEEAREAEAPGHDVKSPILNAFGNNLIKELGGNAINDLTTEPEKLAAAYGYKHDVDSDGIPDAQEYLDGTDPTNSQSGRPWLLFQNNLRRNWFAVIAMAAGTFLLTWGLKGLFRYYQANEIAGE